MIFILLIGMILDNFSRYHRLAFAASDTQTELQSWQEPPEIEHSSMEIRIGYPAIVRPGQEYPSIVVYPSADGTLHANVVRKKDNSVDKHVTVEVSAGDEIDISFDGTPDPGRYRIDLNMEFDEGEGTLPDSYYFSVLNPEELPDHHSVVAHPGDDGRLVYTPDYRGNRIPDFSHVGYKSSEEPVPDVPVVMILEPEPGDDTDRIQEAIDELGSMTLNEDGFRGALLLKQGVYEIEGVLRVRDSGVVIRGEGQGDFKSFWLDPAKGYTLDELKDHLEDKIEDNQATVLIATGQERRLLINVGGSSGPEIDTDSAHEILDQYVPVGAYSFIIEATSTWEDFNIGDKIMVERRGNQKWIEEIGMNQIPPRDDGRDIVQWSPFNLEFENVVVDIDGNRIWLKYPIMNAIEKRWGGGLIYRYTDPERISQAGIENLRAISYWKPNAGKHIELISPSAYIIDTVQPEFEWKVGPAAGVDDTRHSDRFLNFDNIKNGWARNLTVEHFYGTSGAFSTGRGSIGITFMDSSTLIAHPDFYEGYGYDSSGRTYGPTGVYVGRYGWRLQGQGALVKRTYAINNRHAYALGSRVEGPNVFLDGLAEQSLTWSEPHHRWAAGGLFDTIEESYGIALMNRLSYGTGHGWAGANFVAWNTGGGEVVVEQPPTAQNWAIGHNGRRARGPFHDWNIDMFGYSFGYTGLWRTLVEPGSLYRQQLMDRLGDDAPEITGFTGDDEGS